MKKKFVGSPEDAEIERLEAKLNAQATEIARLSAALAVANAQAERYERLWYLRGDALEQLQKLADAYPVEVWPEPDLKRAHELLSAGGMGLDSISAHVRRSVLAQIRAIVREGLGHA